MMMPKLKKMINLVVRMFFRKYEKVRRSIKETLAEMYEIGKSFVI